MNLHDLIAGESVTNTDLEERVSQIIGTVLLTSLIVNIVAVPLAVQNIKARIKYREFLKSE